MIVTPFLNFQPLTATFPVFYSPCAAANPFGDDGLALRLVAPLIVENMFCIDMDTSGMDTQTERERDWNAFKRIPPRPDIWPNIYVDNLLLSSVLT